MGVVPQDRQILPGLIKNILTIRRNMRSSRPVPLSVMVNITGKCNLRCEFCEKGAAPVRSSGEQAVKPAELEFENIKKLVDLADRFDCPLFFGGGEPFLHPQIWEVLEYSRTLNRRVSIVTNGTCFDNLTDEQFNLLGETISIMSVSIDSADPGEHDRIRGQRGTFDKIMRFIRHPNRKCRIAINSVLLPDLVGAEELLALAGRLDCAINFQPIQFETNFPDLPALEMKARLREGMSSYHCLENQLKELHRRARKRGVATNLGLVRQFFGTYCKYANSREFFGDHLLTRFVCCAQLLQITVDEKGQLCPCALLPGKKSAFEGDLYENWCALAVEYRKLWFAGKRWDICRSCSCHFAENFRSSIIAFPVENRQKLLWGLAYYAGRVFRNAARKA